MKIVLVKNCFCKKAGYWDYFIAKYIARAGHEMHIVAGNRQLPYDDLDDIYKDFLGSNITECLTEKFENFYLHTIPVSRIKGKLVMYGIARELRKLQPDIVLVSETLSPTTLLQSSEPSVRLRHETTNR